MSIPGVEALRLLQKELRVGGADDVPAGFYTAKDYATEWGHTSQYTQAILERAVSAGKAECVPFRIVTATGIRPTKHYKLL